MRVILVLSLAILSDDIDVEHLVGTHLNNVHLLACLSNHRALSRVLFGLLRSVFGVLVVTSGHTAGQVGRLLDAVGLAQTLSKFVIDRGFTISGDSLHS